VACNMVAVNFICQPFPLCILTEKGRRWMKPIDSQKKKTMTGPCLREAAMRFGLNTMTEGWTPELVETATAMLEHADEELVPATGRRVVNSRPAPCKKSCAAENRGWKADTASSIQPWESSAPSKAVPVHDRSLTTPWTRNSEEDRTENARSRRRTGLGGCAVLAALIERPPDPSPNHRAQLPLTHQRGQGGERRRHPQRLRVEQGLKGRNTTRCRPPRAARPEQELRFQCLLKRGGVLG